MRELEKPKSGMINSGFSMFQLDLKRIPKLCGKQATKRFEELYQQMVHTRYALLFVGRAGTGKTVMALNLIARYAEDNGVPAFFVQISPEMTKSLLVIGKRLVAGSLQTVKGCVAHAAEMGAPILVDECTQGTPEVLANMQQLLERTAMLTDGDEIVYAKEGFRIIFCANPSRTHAANVPLPTAFANRLVTYTFDFPDFEDEIEITKEILADREFNHLPNEVPDPVIRYVVSLMREHRSEVYPLGPRNSAMCISVMNVLDRTSNDNSKSSKGTLEERFRAEMNLGSAQNMEAQLSTIYTRVHGTAPSSTVTLTEDADVKQFAKFICRFGAKRFVENVKSAFMVNLEIDSIAADMDKIKQNIVNSIL